MKLFMIKYVITPLLYIFIISFHLIAIYVGYRFILLSFTMWSIVLAPQDRSLPGAIQRVLIRIFGDYTNELLAILSLFTGLSAITVMSISLLMFIFNPRNW